MEAKIQLFAVFVLLVAASVRGHPQRSDVHEQEPAFGGNSYERFHRMSQVNRQKIPQSLTHLDISRCYRITYLQEIGTLTARGCLQSALITINAARTNALEMQFGHRGFTVLLVEMNLASFFQEGSHAILFCFGDPQRLKRSQRKKATETSNGMATATAWHRQRQKEFLSDLEGRLQKSVVRLLVGERRTCHVFFSCSGVFSIFGHKS